MILLSGEHCMFTDEFAQSGYCLEFGVLLLMSWWIILFSIILLHYTSASLIVRDWELMFSVNPPVSFQFSASWLIIGVFGRYSVKLITYFNFRHTISRGRML